MFDQTLHHTETSLVGVTSTSVAVAIISPPVVHSYATLPLSSYRKYDARQTHPSMRSTTCNPVNLTVCQNIHSSGTCMVIQIEDQTSVGSTAVRKLSKKIPTVAFDQTTDETATRNYLVTRTSIRVSIPSPVIAQAQARLSDRVNNEGHTTETEPTVTSATSNPMNLTVCENIYPRRLGVVVQVENQSPVRTAIAW